MMPANRSGNPQGFGKNLAPRTEAQLLSGSPLSFTRDLLFYFTVLDSADFVAQFIFDGRVGAGDEDFVPLLRIETPLVILRNKSKMSGFGIIFSDIKVRHKLFPPAL